MAYGIWQFLYAAKEKFCLNAFPHGSQLYCFSIVWNGMCLSTSTLVVLDFPHSIHILLKFCKWLFVHTVSKFIMLWDGCFPSRHIMKNIHIRGPCLQILREYACINILECSPRMCICCRGTEMFHEQTECAPLNYSSLLRIYHSDHT